MIYFITFLMMLAILAWITERDLRADYKSENEALNKENTNLKHQNHKLKNLLAQKKELLEIQDRIIADYSK